MMRGFYNGISGVKTQSFSMDVVSNNISNVNTVGFKSSRPEFASIFYQTNLAAGNNPTTDQVGLGARGQTTALNMNMGSFVNTDNKFDFAIQGNGYFAVTDSYGATYYTRNGGFDIDAAGNLVDINGRFVQGTLNPISPTTPTNTAMATYGSKTAQAFTLNQIDSLELANENEQQNIVLPHFLYQPANPTKNVDIRGNLDSSKLTQTQYIELENASFSHEVDENAKTIKLSGNVKNSPNVLEYRAGDSVVVKVASGDKFSEITTQIDGDGNWQIDDYTLRYMDVSNLAVTSTLITQQEVANKQKMSTDLFTANGTKNLLTLEYTKQLPQAKDSTTWDLVATITDPNGNLVAKNEGVMTFGPNATLISSTITSVGGINLNFGKVAPDGTSTGLVSSNQTARNEIKRDGYAEGVLKSYETTDNGVILANFNNGMMFPVARVALYHFQNEQGLAKMGDNVYTKTSNSGEPFFYRNNNNEIILGASIVSNRLENSNVDLGDEFTQMIVTQKAYDASAKSITTSDEMIQTAINMKQ